MGKRDAPNLLPHYHRPVTEDGEGVAAEGYIKDRETGTERGREGLINKGGG